MYGGFLLLVSGAAQHAEAQSLDFTLTYTLNNVTFNDGAVAFGYFNYNPVFNTFGAYNITTTNGVTDSFTGANYQAGPDVAQPQGLGGGVFDFQNNDATFPDPYTALLLNTEYPADVKGVYPLAPGYNLTPTGGFSGSGEYATQTNALNEARVVATGSLVVSSAVPEASTTVSFGLLLALGLGGAVLAKKKVRA